MAYWEQCCLEEVSGSKALGALGLAGPLHKRLFFTKPGSKLQSVKIVVSDCPGLVDFAIRLVIFVLNFPDGQVLFFGEIQITEGL